MPYNEKILRIAQEPVAFHLYKNRDFYILDPRSKGQKHLNNKKDFKNELLRIANAKLISANKFKQIVDHHIERGWPLPNRILNIPSKEEA
jgi:hypothetical protein